MSYIYIYIYYRERSTSVMSLPDINLMDLLDDAFLKDAVKDEMLADHICDVTAVSPE